DFEKQRKSHSSESLATTLLDFLRSTYSKKTKLPPHSQAPIPSWTHRQCSTSKKGSVEKDSPKIQTQAKHLPLITELLPRPCILAATTAVIAASLILVPGIVIAAIIAALVASLVVSLVTALVLIVGRH
ncbi:hypothetical protein QBC38DRAFT_525530, partial [Podospora fimiseda]